VNLTAVPAGSDTEQVFIRGWRASPSWQVTTLGVVVTKPAAAVAQTLVAVRFNLTVLGDVGVNTAVTVALDTSGPS
jgi:hypothetical protein